MKVLIIDTETGGTDAARHSILSVGAVAWNAGQPCAEIEVFINEERPSLTQEAMAINKIDIAAHIEKADKPGVALAKFENFVSTNFRTEISEGGKVILCGHNVAFDISFLKRWYSLAGKDFSVLFSHRSLDTAAVLQFLALKGEIPSSATSSDAAFSYFNIEIPTQERHTALGDARATSALLSQLILQ